MRRHLTLRYLAVLALVAATVSLASPASGATSPPKPITPIAKGLNGPGGLSSDGKYIYVAEGDAGQVTRINRETGAKTTVFKGLKSPTAVAVSNGLLAILTGEGQKPNVQGDTSLILTLASHGPKPAILAADLEKYELAHNPDGQLQFDPKTHEPLDSVSNPFALLTKRGSPGAYFVADAGANDVLVVTSQGHVSTFFVPPLVTTGGCKGAPNNDPQHVGCDPVPTGLAYGPNNTLYVSTLSSLVPGQGRVYVLNATTGRVLGSIRGLDAPTGVAVGPDGAVYVSEVTYGAPEGEGPPPPGFDPSKVGRIVRISWFGRRTYAHVPMSLGLTFAGGTLYSSAWSIAGQIGMPNAGRVVAVHPSAFRPT